MNRCLRLMEGDLHWPSINLHFFMVRTVPSKNTTKPYGSYFDYPVYTRILDNNSSGNNREITENNRNYLNGPLLIRKKVKRMSINFGIKTECPKCTRTLNCYCRDNEEHMRETSGGLQYVPKTMEDFDNIFNYIEWIGETGIGYEMDFSQFEEIEEYIKEILLENDKLTQLLVISQGFDPNFKSIIKGEPLWPSEEE